MASRPPEHSSAEVVDLRQYLAVLRRQRRLIVLFTLAGLLAAGLYTYTRPPVYTATAKLVVQPTGINLSQAAPSGPVKLVSLPTEAEVMTSTDVATLAARALGSTATPQSLLERVSVSIPTDAQVLAVSYSDGDPRVAMQGAIAFAEAYLSFRQSEAEDSISQRAAALNGKITELNKKIRSLNQIIATAPHDSTTAGNAEAEKEQLAGQISLFQTQLADLAGLNTDPGQIVFRPLPPNHPSSPNHALGLALGLFLGLTVGMVSAVFRSRTDQRVYERGTLEEAIGVPVLAVVPRIREWNRRQTPMLVTLDDPKSPAAEAYRALRPALLVAAAERGVKSIMVVSPLAGEGKTTTAANLAVALAQADKRVWLISADLHRPRIHEFFGLDNQRGLADVLSGDADPWDATEQSRVPNLWILPSGPLPDNPAELLQSDDMRHLLNEEGDKFDFIVLDCPPVLAVADVLGLVSSVDAILFVADAASSKRDVLRTAREQLEQVRAPLLGAVLNNLAVEQAKLYPGYGYGYGDRAAVVGERVGQAERFSQGLGVDLDSGPLQVQESASTSTIIPSEQQVPRRS